MKILKLPDRMEPQKILIEKVMKRDLKCPFCKKKISKWIISNSIEWDDWEIVYRHIRQSSYSQFAEGAFPIHWKKIHWFGYVDPTKEEGEKREWERLKCKCIKCGAEWMGDPYPRDVMEELE